MEEEKEIKDLEIFMIAKIKSTQKKSEVLS